MALGSSPWPVPQGAEVSALADLSWLERPGAWCLLGRCREAPLRLPWDLPAQRPASTVPKPWDSSASAGSVPSVLQQLTPHLPAALRSPDLPHCRCCPAPLPAERSPGGSAGSSGTAKSHPELRSAATGFAALLPGLTQGREYFPLEEGGHVGSSASNLPPVTTATNKWEHSIIHLPATAKPENKEQQSKACSSSGED